MVEYGVGKPKCLLEFFRQEAIKKAFRQAFDHNNPSILLGEVEVFLDTYNKKNDIKALQLDVMREVAAFATVFIEVTKRIRVPSDVLMGHQIGSLHEIIFALQEKLDRLPTLEGIRTEMARLVGQSYPTLPLGGQNITSSVNQKIQHDVQQGNIHGRRAAAPRTAASLYRST